MENSACFIEIDIFVCNSMKSHAAERECRVQHYHYNLYFFWSYFSKILILLNCNLKKLYQCIITCKWSILIYFSYQLSVQMNQRHKMFLFVILTMWWYFQVVFQTHSRKRILCFCDIHIWHCWALSNNVGRKQRKNGTLTEPRIL